MNSQLKKIISCLIGLFGLLSIAVLWQENHQRQKGLVVATLPHFELAEVDGLTIARGGKQLVIKKEQSGWQLKGEEKPASEALVLGLLTALQETELGDVVAESNSRLEAYEIADPQATVVTLSNGTNTVYKLLFGKRGKDGTVFLRLPQKPQVFRGIKAPLHQLKMDSFYWREKQLFDLLPEQIDSLVGRIDGSSYTIYRDGTSYTIAGDDIDDHFRLDQDRVRALIRNLVTLKAVGFNDQDTIYFNQPYLTFDLYSQEKHLRLLVNPADEQRQHQAIVEENNQVYLLAASVVDQLFRPAQLLRDLRLFNIQLSDITAVRIKNNHQISLLRNPEGDFVLDGQTDSAFDSLTANRVVRDLANLRASSFSQKKTEPPLDVAQSYALSDGSSWHTVNIGATPDEKGQLQATGDFPGLYGLAAINLRRFSAGLEMFHKPPLSNNGNIDYESLQKLPPDIQKKILQQIQQQQ